MAATRGDRAAGPGSGLLRGYAFLGAVTHVRCARTNGPRGPSRAGPAARRREAISLLTLDLHPIFRNNRDIDVALRQALFKAAATGVDVVQIIPGKGTGQLKKRVLALLSQNHIKKLYSHVETDPANTGRILVHLR